MTLPPSTHLPPQPPLTIGSLLDAAGYLLTQAGCSSPRLDAEVLLSYLLGRTRTWLCTWPEREVDADTAAGFARLIARRQAREPVAYITTRRAFYELELEVSRACLIPRPETELLVETALDWLRLRAASVGRPMRVLDLCTGSGAIAVSIAHARADCVVIATDISPAALGVAERNATATGVADRVILRCGDLFSAVERGEQFDLITANPPYIAQEELPSLDPDVRDHEPHLALVAARGGFDLIERILEGSPALLCSSGAVAIEIGANQGGRTLDRTQHLTYHSVQIKQDASGRDRLVWAECPP